MKNSHTQKKFVLSYNETDASADYLRFEDMAYKVIPYEFIWWPTNIMDALINYCE